MSENLVDPRNIEVVDVKYQNDGKRIYVVEDEKGKDDGEYVSVTSKLSDTVPMGEGFYKYLGNADSYRATQEYMKKRGQIGTKVHDYCEMVAKGERYSLTNEKKEVRKRVEQFCNWMSKYSPKIIDTEFVVFCKEFNYAGRVDLLAEIDGDRVLIDYKTSKDVYDKHKLQLMLYRYGLEEGGVDIDRCAVLLLKNNDYKFVEVDYHPKLVESMNVFYDWLADSTEEDIPVLEVEE